MLQYTQITSIISQLLYKHDCVIVPNFGGFVARHYTSSFSKGNDLLFPPSKQILFNKNLIHNDGLLISELAKENNISFIEAEKLITDYKDYILSLLSAKKRFELTQIGLLYIDSENNIRFEAKTNINLLLESFGLDPVIANELSLEPEKPIILKQFEDRKAVVEPVLKQKKSYAKVITLAIGLPAILGFLLFAAYSKPMKPILQSSINPFYTPEKTYVPHKYYNKSYHISTITKQTLLADANGFATLKLAENGPILIAAPNDTVIKPDKTLVHKPMLASKHVNNTMFDGKFQVVMGCFGIEQNAAKLISTLKNKHIQAAISGMNAKGMYVVSCGGFNSKEEAANLLASVKPTHPNAWIMAK